jgi:retron-type reverse transcriptase
LGITVLEDKLVQRAMVQVLSAIYETDFKGFSHGFRPRRSPHDALDALSVGIRQLKVNWVLDADICGFLDPSSYYTPFNEDWLKSVGWLSNAFIRKPLRLP